ncbi:MAG: GntR family transcriptional regulator [Anaerolineaceae bacterium]|nr:GntR family transcriptional regulator [Anaerolineaceae bacterium]
MIDPSGAVPKYYQLANIIRQLIENGDFQPYNAIPSERMLEERYNLSRPTIRQAINLLSKQGYLYRVQGKGTFVSPPKLQKGMLELTSFSEDMLSRGLTPGHKILEFGYVKPDAKTRRQLKIEDKDKKVLRIKRLRFGDNEPIGLQDSYLSLGDKQTITREEIEKKGSIYAILREKLGIYPTEADETLEVTLATREEANLLNIAEGNPLLLNERTLWSQDRKAIEFVRILYRGDRYKYFIHLTRQ